MSNLESPGPNSSRGLGGVESGESSDFSFSTPNAYLEHLDFPLEDSQDGLRSDCILLADGFFDGILSANVSDDALTSFVSSHPPEGRRNGLKRAGAPSNHKGVHFRQKNKKFVSRLCLPGGKNRKLDLGEYNTHDEAARAYQVGAFYYNKSNCVEDTSFSETLPCVPDNLSDVSKMAWVRERARHSAASIGTSKAPPLFPSLPVFAGSPLDARPGTPASYGTQGSCDDYHSTPTTLTTSGSADLDNSFWPSCDSIGCATMLEKMGEDRVDFLRQLPGDALVNHRKGKSARHNTSESKRQRCLETLSQGSLNVELQQGRNSGSTVEK